VTSPCLSFLVFALTWKSHMEKCWKRVANHPDIALELLTSREIYWHFVCQSVYVESDNVSSSFWMYCTWTDLDGVYDFCRCITHADAPYQLFLRIGANGRWGQLLRLYSPSCDLICWLLTESFRIPVTQGVACDEVLVQFHITV
jgi:hypothetical protein